MGFGSRSPSCLVESLGKNALVLWKPALPVWAARIIALRRCSKRVKQVFESLTEPGDGEQH